MRIFSGLTSRWIHCRQSKVKTWIPCHENTASVQHGQWKWVRQALLLNWGPAAFVVSRRYINCCSAKGKEFLLKRSHKNGDRGFFAEAGGGRRPEESKNKLKGTVESESYTLFVAEVDTLKRLPGDAFGEGLWNTVRHEQNRKKMVKLIREQIGLNESKFYSFFGGWKCKYFDCTRLNKSSFSNSFLQINSVRQEESVSSNVATHSSALNNYQQTLWMIYYCCIL